MAAQQQLQPAATRARLLEAAGTLFAVRGYRGATLREIAARAGVNLAAANYHFGSKQELYLEVAREHFEALARRLAEQGGQVGDAELARLSRRQLEALLRARIRILLETLLERDPVHAALMQRELIDPSEVLPVIVRRWIEPLRDATAALIARLEPGLDAPAVERCTRSVVGQAWLYLTHRPALLLMMGRRAYPAGFVDDAADHLTEFTLGGIERLARARRARSRA